MMMILYINQSILKRDPPDFACKQIYIIPTIQFVENYGNDDDDDNNDD